MNEQITYKIETVYTLKQPLSHIGESESTTTFLNTIRVINGGRPVEVFAYTGNAIRGAWRDAGAKYLLDRLHTTVPKKAFHLLFSGGSIGGEQVNDVEAAKLLRKNLPFLSVFGGGVGNQILSGKFTQSFALPVCEETSDVVPRRNGHIDQALFNTSWKLMTGEIQFSRKDDSKDKLGDEYILVTPEQTNLLDGEKRKKADDGPATQMRYAVEYMAPGAQLWHEIKICCTELELGALVSAIHEWAQNPVLGGMNGKGFGMVDMDMDITGGIPFISVKNGSLALADMARDVKDQYDIYLRDIYDRVLDGNRDKLVRLLEASK